MVEIAEVEPEVASLSVDDVQLADRSKTDLVFDHIANGRTNEALALLQSGEVSPDSNDENKTSILQQACFKGNYTLCKYLINEAKVDVNRTEHESAYTALMFAALSGSTDICELLLDAGADPDKRNSINRTASELAGFTGQNACSALLQNFLDAEWIERYVSKPSDSKKHISPPIGQTLLALLRTNNTHPVRIVLFVVDHEGDQDLIKWKDAVLNVLEEMVDDLIKAGNEIVSFKTHIIFRTLKACFDSYASHAHFEGLGKCPFSGVETKPEQSRVALLSLYIKHLLTAANVEKLLRQCIREYPHHNSLLLQQSVRQLAKTPIPERLNEGESTAWRVLSNILLGRRQLMDATFCAVCCEAGARKRCARCHGSCYCDARCQKYGWNYGGHGRTCKAKKELEAAKKKKAEKLQEEMKTVESEGAAE